MSAPPPRQPGQAAPTAVTTGRGSELSRAHGRRSRLNNTTHRAGETPAPGPVSRPTRIPRLRLTHSPPPTVRNAPRPTALQGSADPRWVLAVRTAELLQGDILTPECRERIVRMGRMFNLTPFDANMVIAIVQDQARRGIAPHLCPTAGEPQLRMISPPRRRTFKQIIRSRYSLTLASLLAVLLAIEALLIIWVF
jgi:hypothetical protein